MCYDSVFEIQARMEEETILNLPAWLAVFLSLFMLNCETTGPGIAVFEDKEVNRAAKGKERDTMQEKGTVYLTTIPEYRACDPDRAKEQAAADIRSADIRVFFLSVEEVPYPLIIEDGLETLPPYTYVAIGGGCTDEIGSPDVAEDYRAAFQRAVRYGELYNETLARHFGLKMKPGRQNTSSSRSMNRTQAFLGEEAGRGDIRMELKDVMGPFGDRDVIVHGSGKATVHMVRPRRLGGGTKKKVYKILLDEGDIRALVEAFIANDFLDLVLPDERMPPDTGHPVITLVNGQGQSHTLEGWERTSLSPDADPSDPIVRFDRVYKELLRIERVAESSQ